MSDSHTIRWEEAARLYGEKVASSALAHHRHFNDDRGVYWLESDLEEVVALVQREMDDLDEGDAAQ
jgi:hypothetical protein